MKKGLAWFCKKWMCHLRRLQGHELLVIGSHHVTISKQHLGSGSYGGRYLGTYRNTTIVVKNFHIKELQEEKRHQAKNRVRYELIYEARVTIINLATIPGFLFSSEYVAEAPCSI